MDKSEIYVRAKVFTLEEDSYRSCLEYAFDNLGLLDLLKCAPYDITGKYSTKGGLLDYTANLLSLYNNIACYFPNINTSLVSTGCILRNIGYATTTYFDKNEVLRLTDAFKMTGIDRASARYINHLFISCESDLDIYVPENEKQILENLCNPLDKIKSKEGEIIYHCSKLAEKI